MASFLPPPPAAAVTFMEQAVEFEWLRGNLFKVIDPNTGIIRIAEASVLAETISNAARCYRDYRTRGSAEVIPFPDRAEAGH